jgi:putative ABC transport system permease protein
MIKNYFKTAWRNLVRHKTYAFTNLAGLSIGLATVMLIMLFVSDELSYDKFNTNAGQLYRVVHEGMSPEGNIEKGGNTGGPQAAAFKATVPEIAAVCRLRGGWQELIKKGTEAISENITYADTNFFQVFSFPLLQGNPTSALKDWNNVVISEAMAVKYFNTADALGKILEINQEGKFARFTVSGVAKNSPLNSSIRFDFMIPIERTLQEDWTKQWMTSFLNTFVLLDKHAIPGAVTEKLNTVLHQQTGKMMEELKKKYPNVYYRYSLQPFLQLHLDKQYNAGNGLSSLSDASYSYILGGIGLFILIIACINFVNLTLSRSLQRGKEVGIRKVSGSTRSQLVWQYMGESLLLNLAAFIPAIILVQVCLPFFSSLANKELSVAYIFHARHLFLFLTLILVNSVLSGWYPALVLSGFNPVQTLYGKTKFAGRNYLAKGLVIVQFVIAVFLMAGTLVMHRQFNYMLHKDTGYATAGIIDVEIPYEQRDRLQSLKNELAKYPYIQQTAAQSISITGMNTTAVEIDKKEIFDVPFFKMDEQVLPMLQMKILQGKNFMGVPADTNRCIINAAMVKAAGLKDPIGHFVNWNDHRLEIIAVVADFNTSSLKNKIAPCLIQQVPNQAYTQLMVKIDESRKAAAVQTIQRVFKSQVPFYPCNYTFLSDEISRQYGEEKRWKDIISFAAILSMLISCLGLFGLAALNIASRTREIGIRKVLGAHERSIVQLVSKDFLLLVLTGVVIAIPIAWYFTHHWLQDFAYRAPLSAWIFLLAGALAVAVSLLTISFQAIRAALANPVKSLRTE